MKKDWNRAAMRFASAGYLSRQRMLVVTFENGDHFLVATESILPAASNGKSKRSGSTSQTGSSIPPDWSKMRVGETGDVLEVPASGEVIEISWDRIRSVADPDFRAHLADRAVDRARHIGARLLVMRNEVGLTRAALAEKVGVTRVTRKMVADLEVGKIEPEDDLIANIVLALGRRLHDLAEESPQSPEQGRGRQKRPGKRLLRVPAE